MEADDEETGGAMLYCQIRDEVTSIYLTESENELLWRCSGARNHRYR